MKSTKFIACVLGTVAIVWLSLAGKMDGNVALSLSVVIGGYYGGNSYINGKALANGKDTNGADR